MQCFSDSNEGLPRRLFGGRHHHRHPPVAGLADLGENRHFAQESNILPLRLGPSAAMAEDFDPFAGRRLRLAPGRYRWYVWPGFGSRARLDTGRRLGAPRSSRAAGPEYPPPGLDLAQVHDVLGLDVARICS